MWGSLITTITFCILSFGVADERDIAGAKSFWASTNADVFSGTCTEDGYKEGIYNEKVRIYVHNWTSHLLQTWIIKLLLEERLGYDVEIIDEFTGGTPTFEGIGTDKGDVNIEVWGHGKQGEIDAWIGTGKVEDIGLLGNTGRSGIYVTSRTLDPDGPYYFADFYKSFQRNEGLVNLLKEWSLLDTFESFNSGNYVCQTNEEREKLELVPANCENGIFKPHKCEADAESDCGILWGMTPDYDPSSLQVMVNNLDMNLSVAWVGLQVTPDLTYESWVREYFIDQQNHGVFYYWEPTALPNIVCDEETGEKCFKRVTFPEGTSKCTESFQGDVNDKDYNCDFATSFLFKMSNPLMQERTPRAYSLIKSYVMGNADIGELLVTAEIGGQDDKKRIACDWILENKKTWEPWIEPIPDFTLTTIAWDSSTATAIIVMVAILSFFALIFLVYTIMGTVKMELVVLRSQPLLLILTALGALLYYGTILLNIGVVTDGICMSRLITWTIAFVLFVGSIICRVFRVFQTATHDLKARSDFNLLGILAIALFSNAAVFIIYLLVDRSIRVEALIEGLPKQFSNDVLACTTTPALLVAIIFILNGTALVAGIRWAYKIRNVDMNANESFYLNLAMFSTAVSAITMTAVSYGGFDPRASAVARSVVAIIGVTLVLWAIFIPKMVLSYQLSSGKDVEDVVELANFQHVLIDPIIASYFAAFTRSNLAGENMAFIDACSQFKWNHMAWGNERIFREATDIVDTFVKEGAREQINIEHRHRKAIQEIIEGHKEGERLDAEIFDECVTYIAKTLKLNSFYEFLHSQQSIRAADVKKWADNFNELPPEHQSAVLLKFSLIKEDKLEEYVRSRLSSVDVAGSKESQGAIIALVSKKSNASERKSKALNNV